MARRPRRTWRPALVREDRLGARARSIARTSARASAITSIRAASTPMRTRRACWSAPGRRDRTEPATPVPYSEEVWTGLEYMLASHLIARGLVEEGLTVVRAARARHDGSRRNPWNDIECGSYYARSLSSYALRQRLERADLRPAHRRDRLSARRAAGTRSISGRRAAAGARSPSRRDGNLSVKGGELAVSRLRLPSLAGPATVDGKAARRDGDVILLSQPRLLRAGERIVVGAGERGAA